MVDVKKLWTIALAILAVPVAVFAQEAGAPSPADDSGSGVNLDLVRQLVVVVIPVLTPLIIAGVKKVTGVIPSAALPIIAPILGVVLSAVGNALNIPGLEGAGIVEGAVLGSAGVGVREVVDQGKKKVVG